MVALGVEVAADDIAAMIRTAIPDAEVQITDLAGDGDHYAAHVVAASFAGMSRVARTTLTAADGHRFSSWRADPSGTPKGGIVVIQEIFGVNQHIRNVCDRFAEEGYVAVAPALFDRTQKDFQSGYTPPEIEKAREAMVDVLRSK